jgi:predicted metal-dependent phosphoesterase TrpH
MSAHFIRESPVNRAVTQEAQALAHVFQSIHIASCPQTYNFHMHTHYSDGKLSPEEIMAQALEIGLQGLAITDHHNIKGYLQARRWIEDWQWSHPTTWRTSSDQPQSLPHLWVGIEINALLADTEVHILGYAFDPKHPALNDYLEGGGPKGPAKQAKNIIQAIQTAGGIAILAHPARYRTPPEDLIPVAANLGIDGVETYYAYDNPVPWRPTPDKTQQITLLAKRYQLLSSCGTDTHGRSLIRRL